MSDFEQSLWKRNKEMMDELIILKRALAKVLISPSHEDARNAAKEAFATVALNDPFAPTETVQAAEEVRKAS